jgi:hypothetical protein
LLCFGCAWESIPDAFSDPNILAMTAAHGISLSPHSVSNTTDNRPPEIA